MKDNREKRIKEELMKKDKEVIIELYLQALFEKNLLESEVERLKN